MLSFEKDVSLRERKHAKTKIILAQEFLRSLNEPTSGDVSIRSICEKAEVSEGTFYNYFPQKTDIFNFIVNLYDKKAVIETDSKVSRETPFEWMAEFFDDIVKKMIEFENMSNEIFSMMLKERITPRKINISNLEFLYMFPEMEGLEGENVDWWNNGETLFEDSLDDVAERIVSTGKVKDAITKQDIIVYFKTVLGGVPFLRNLYRDEDIAGMMKKQLSIFRDGVRK